MALSLCLPSIWRFLDGCSTCLSLHVENRHLLLSHCELLTTLTHLSAYQAVVPSADTEPCYSSSLCGYCFNLSGFTTDGARPSHWGVSLGLLLASLTSHMLFLSYSHNAFAALSMSFFETTMPLCMCAQLISLMMCCS